MTTASSEATLHSDDHHHNSTRIFVGVAGLIAGGIAVGGILVEGGRYGGDTCQPRVELCPPTDHVWLPDEPAQKDPTNPLRDTRIIAPSTSTISPTSMGFGLPTK